MRSLTCALAVLAASCAGPPPRPASAHNSPGAEPDAPAGRRVALLGGHVTVAVPASWSGEVRDSRIAGAVVESTLALEPSGTGEAFAFPRFQMTITELHARTSGDVSADAREVFRDDWRLDDQPDPSGRVAWVLAELREWDGQSPFVVLGALLVHDDRSLQRVVFRVAAEVAASERPAYARRARAIVASVRREEPWSTSASTQRIADRLTVEIPEGYRFTCEPTPPREPSCGVRHLRSVGGRSHGLLTLRLVPADRVPLPPPSGAAEVEEAVLDRQVPWHLSRGDEIVMTTAVRLDELRLEIRLLAPDEEGQRALLSIVRSLRPAR